MGHLSPEKRKEKTQISEVLVEVKRTTASTASSVIISP